ncbi:hypothetical protein A2955_05000 [Candidatus Woesebacteria bacterium RIFCSPLOWO2_01_FULL_37_19]|uniref:Uncharacterized protein n=1 Tax=Candidatus Woesebacteria bacterium RIFCSPLOWO2_01_FULL_37_19 TaxID=1802514 RepID=A0A1F8B004_9BACT|nr:MAG: hypothetical protein A2955_05000 [Candidatus Woesebacteria bacterium RIFCSPLOWO2_01_FULL_37_19]
MGYGPPYGIPIPEEVHDLYSPEVKEAWGKFDAWWKEALYNSDGNPVSRNTMPQNVCEAMDLILQTSIPGYEEDGITGADSCYMIGVLMLMTD